MSAGRGHTLWSHDLCRQGAQFVEVWVDGFQFKDLLQRQENIGSQREELEKQKKLLSKRRPGSGGGGGGGGGRGSPAQPGKSKEGFAKPQLARCVCVGVGVGRGRGVCGCGCVMYVACPQLDPTGVPGEG